MKIINIKTDRSQAELLAIIRDNDRVNRGVRFADKKGGKPFMHVKEKEGRVSIRCEMVGRPTKDNAFLIGTRFYGRIKEKDGITTLKGITVTSPIYHVFVLLLMVFLVVHSIVNKTIGSIPIMVFAIAFEFMFFYDELKKQGYIERYLYRAQKRLEADE